MYIFALQCNSKYINYMEIKIMKNVQDSYKQKLKQNAECVHILPCGNALRE